MKNGGGINVNRLTTVPQASLIKCCGCIEESNCYGEIACNQITKGIEKLKLYEDTGISPEEIIDLKEAIILFYKDFPKNAAKAIDMMPPVFFSSKGE